MDAMARGCAWFACRIRASLLPLVAVSVVYGVFVGLYELDSTRLLWKLWRTDDPYRYDEIHPRFLKTDPAALITIRSPEDAVATRHALIDAIWGPDGFPVSKQPAELERDVGVDGFDDLPNLDRIDRVHARVDADYTAFADLYRAQDSRNRLVLLHDGYGGDGTYGNLKRPIAALLRAGIDVMVFSLPQYNRNEMGNRYLPRYGWYAVHSWRALDLVDWPMRLWIEPVVIGMNHTRADGSYESVDMMGFSAGGWVTMVAAAVDLRIRRSYPVAGVYPLFLRSREEAKQSPRPEFYAPMIRAANYLEMFVLAALGRDRAQIQVFNRYDRCCYNNRKGELYEPAVVTAIEDAGGGRFAVLIDESHPRHKVSSWATARVIEDILR